MYNAELKQAYIRECKPSEETLAFMINIFNITEPFEANYAEDLCVMSTEHLEAMFDKILGLRERARYNKLSIIRRYISWCVANRVPNSNEDSIRKANVLGIDKVRRCSVAAPSQLQKYLDILYFSENEQTSDDIYRCYFWLAFMGIDHDDILKIKCSDLDFENFVLLYKDSKIPLYHESVLSFKNCATLNSFRYKHPNYREPIWRNRVEGDELLRGVKAMQPLTSFHNVVSRRGRTVKKEGLIEEILSYHGVWLSGLFYRKHNVELNGFEVNFYDIFENAIAKKKISYENDKEYNKARKQSNYNYTNDYMRWKLAHFY